MSKLKKVLSGIIILVSFFTVSVTANAQEKVDINTASLEELQTLDGIGATLGQRIIDSRPYESIDDLSKVKGIGAKTIEKIKAQGLVFVTKKRVDKSGMFGTSPWTWDDETKTLSFGKGEFPETNYINCIDTSIGGKNNYDNSQINKDDLIEIKHIVFEDKVILSPISSHLFYDLRSLEDIEGLKNINTSNVTDMSYMFSFTDLKNLDLSSFDTSNVTDMNWMFTYSYNLTNLDLSSFDTSSVTNMSAMFCGTSLTSIDLSNFKTSNVTDMSNMFSGTSLTSIDLSSFYTSSVTDMSGMFACTNLINLDLSSFDTSSVTDMSYLFFGARSTILDLSSFDTSNVTNMRGMFSSTNLTNLDLSSFDTSNVKDMTSMFEGANILKIDLSSFNMSRVMYMRYMFAYSSIDLGKSNFDWNSIDSSYDVNDLFF